MIAAITTITVYVQRSLQAKVKDANEYMIGMASKGCSQADQASTGDPDWQLNCQGAVGTQNGKVATAYEPYYTQTDAQVRHDEAEHKSEQFGGLGTPGISTKTTAEETEVASVGVQLPPKDAK